MENQKIYDMIIIGCGPAGMTTAVYARRSGLSVLLLEKAVVGGQVAMTYEVKNYPGFTDITGMELSQKMLEQVEYNGADVIYEEATKIITDGDIKTVKTYQNEYKGKTIVLGLGAKPRKLDLSNEKDYQGKGVSYCAVCDGAFFRNKTVAVVGGGNSAFEDAEYLSNIAQKVYLIHRRDEFKAQDILVNALQKKADGDNQKVEFVLNSEVCGLGGEGKLQQIQVKNLVDGSVKSLNVDGLFIAVGRLADTSFLPDEIEIDKFGYIVANEKMETSVPGVYAIGDCIQKQLRQIVTACADGSICATNALVYIKSKKL